MGQHPFRWPRYALTLAAGLAAAAGTWFWLDGPTWRSAEAGTASMPHFSRDGRTITTFHDDEVNPGAPFAPRIVRWEAATGRKLADVPLAWDAPLPAARGRPD